MKKLKFKVLFIFAICLFSISSSLFAQSQQWENFSITNLKPFTQKSVFNKGEVVIKNFSLFAFDRQVTGKWNGNKFTSHSQNMTAELVGNTLKIRSEKGEQIIILTK